MFSCLFTVLLLLGCLSTDAAPPNGTPYPSVASKKGLQVQMIPDALALGIKHAALNINLPGMIDLAEAPGSIKFVSGDGTFHFQRGYMEQIDRQIKALSDPGVVVSLILLNFESGDPALNKITLHPGYDKAAPNHLSAFNTVTPDGIKYFRACVEFLAERYSRADQSHGRVWNYIIGNEVNSHWFWSNMGHVSMKEFAADYERAVRLAHDAIRKYSAHARVFLSLEHHWNIHYAGGDETQTFAGRPFLLEFARLARAQGDFDWNLAFHPYPENLFEPRTWMDKTTTFDENTPRITFKNLGMLVSFFRKPELLYEGKPRHIILSEQGFHTPDGPEGETIQAAAYCYAWVKVNQLDGIDAFILHRHVDHRDEGGLRLGLWTRKADSASDPDRKKKIYEVFRLADTPEWEKAFAFALPIIGIKDWNEIFPAN
jgi:hypothetical protein